MSEAMLREEVERATVLYEDLIRRSASRTRTMIDEHGEVEALPRLMISGDLQQGFKVLRDRDQLDKSFESLVVRFRQLFKDDAVAAAQWRLDHPHDLL